MSQSAWLTVKTYLAKSFTHITLAQEPDESHNCDMTEKEIVLQTIRALPDDCSLEEIAERIEFMAAVQRVSTN